MNPKRNRNRRKPFFLRWTISWSVAFGHTHPCPMMVTPASAATTTTRALYAFFCVRALSQMELTSKSRMRKKRSERKKQLGGINLFRFRWNLLVFVPPFVSLYFSLSLSLAHTRTLLLSLLLSLFRFLTLTKRNHRLHILIAVSWTAKAATLATRIYLFFPPCQIFIKATSYRLVKS